MRWLALAAAIIAGLVDILYLGFVRTQTIPADSQYLRPPFIALFLATMAIAAALATRASATRFRTALLGLSAGGLIGLGFIAIFSIGLPLLVAGALALTAAIMTVLRPPDWAAAGRAGAGFLCALLVFVGGLEVTERALACAPTGYSSGSGQGLVSGPYHYSCANGKLTFKSGACNRGGATIDANGKVVSVVDC